MNWNGIHFPIGNRDIDKFEENNKIILINIFKSDNYLNNNKLILYRGTKNKNIKYKINLPKIFDKDNNYYYILVKNKYKLLHYQNNNNINKTNYCHHYLNPFQSEKVYKKHLENGYMVSEGQQTKIPNKNTYIEFEKHNTKLPYPFVIYTDFECLTTNSNIEIKGTYDTEGALSCSGNSIPRGT